jgi:hypothetical protein
MNTGARVNTRPKIVVFSISAVCERKGLTDRGLFSIKTWAGFHTVDFNGSGKDVHGKTHQR